MPSEGHGHASDDVAHGVLGLFARGHVALGVRREPDAVREHVHGELVDVVRDAEVTPAEQGPGRAARARLMPARVEAPRDSAEHVAGRRDHGLQVVAERPGPG